MDVGQISKELKASLRDLFEDRMDALILFGSHARQEATEASDIDFLLVLRDPTINPFREIGKASFVLNELLLRHGKVISLCATGRSTWTNPTKSFYQTVKAEGIPV